MRVLSRSALLNGRRTFASDLAVMVSHFRQNISERVCFCAVDSSFPRFRRYPFGAKGRMIGQKNIFRGMALYETICLLFQIIPTWAPRKRANHKSELNLHFRTSEENGVLVYSSPSVLSHFERAFYFIIELNQGQLQLRIGVAGYRRRVTLPLSMADSQWHKLSLTMDRSGYVIFKSDGASREFRVHGSPSSLYDTAGPLFVGGLSLGKNSYPSGEFSLRSLSMIDRPTVILQLQTRGQQQRSRLRRAVSSHDLRELRADPAPSTTCHGALGLLHPRQHINPWVSRGRGGGDIPSQERCINRGLGRGPERMSGQKNMLNILTIHHLLTETQLPTTLEARSLLTSNYVLLEARRNILLISIRTVKP